MWCKNDVSLSWCLRAIVMRYHLLKLLQSRYDVVQKLALRHVDQLSSSGTFGVIGILVDKCKIRQVDATDQEKRTRFSVCLLSVNQRKAKVRYR